jgi:hypothetical protein
MRTLFLATAAFAALVMVAPVGNAHAAELSCPGAAIAVHDVTVGLPLLITKVADLDAEGGSKAVLLQQTAHPRREVRAGLPSDCARPSRVAHAACFQLLQ